MRLAHKIQDCVYTVLRRYLKLTADVVLYKVRKELTAFVCHQIVKTYAASYKDLFNSFYLSKPFQ